MIEERIEKYVGREIFMLIYDDGINNVNINELINIIDNAEKLQY